MATALAPRPARASRYAVVLNGSLMAVAWRLAAVSESRRPTKIFANTQFGNAKVS